MPPITLRIVEGADRGRVFSGIIPPITIGREEGNSIQLNDERVSRYHVKIQEDHEKLVLTDLESTNGTKVNGEETQLRILRHGDVMTVGRSTLLYGSRQEISKRLEGFEGDQSKQKFARDSSASSILPAEWKEDANYQLALLENDPPILPERMSPGQAAQLAEVLEYIHMRMRRLIGEVEVEGHGKAVHMNFAQWQYLIDLQARLSEYLRVIGYPSES